MILLSVKFFSVEKDQLIGRMNEVMTPKKSPLFAPEHQKKRYIIVAHDDRRASLTALARNKRDIVVGNAILDIANLRTDTKLSRYEPLY